MTKLAPDIVTEHDAGIVKQRVRQQLSSHVALVLDSCHQVPELDLPMEVLFEAGRLPAVVNDPARIAAVNTAARAAAASVGFHVDVIDPGPYLCPNGYQDSLEGVQLRVDGLHFTTEGSRVVWRWLGPRLVEGANASSAH